MEENMTLFKRITLSFSSLAFFVGLYVASAEAQRYTRWGGNSGRYYERNYDRGYDRSRTRWTRSSSRYGYLSWRERQRLARQRYALYNSRNRYYRDGYLSRKERRKLAKRYMKYRRSTYSGYRNW